MEQPVKKKRVTRYQRKILSVLDNRGGCIVYDINSSPKYKVEGFGAVQERSIQTLLSRGLIASANDGLSPDTPQSFVLARPEVVTL